MADLEKDREDPFAEARSLTPKILLPIQVNDWQEMIGSPATIRDERVPKSLVLPDLPNAGLAGLFRDGRLAVYLGQDWMIRLSTEHQVLRAYRFGLLFRVDNDGRLIQIIRNRTDLEVQLLESLVESVQREELIREWKLGIRYALLQLQTGDSAGQWRYDPGEISNVLPVLIERLDAACTSINI